MIAYDDAGNIGKRYRRGDAIGIPYSVTIDDTTLEKGTVTVRERDSMQQITVPVKALNSYLRGVMGA
jgi:glycyl-tRNA synthetase